MRSRTALCVALLAGCGGTPTVSGPDLGVGFDLALANDPLGRARRDCTFTAGARVQDTLAVSADDRAKMPIKNVIVMMKENRSFDHILGKLHDQGQPDAEPLVDVPNLDAMKRPVPPFHLPTTCVSHDPTHQWFGMHTNIDNGDMDGFVSSCAASTGTDGHFAMGYYDQGDLPFYYFLANTYAVADRHFSSEASGTFPNRNFMLYGTADGVTMTGAGYPDPSTPMILDLLDKANVTWGVYSDGSLFSGSPDWNLTHRGAHDFKSFLDALDAGTLPQVAFVDGIDNVEDEHPTADLQVGERWTRTVYDHVTASKLWPGIALIWTYDESGGFYDHVPPPETACVARPIAKDHAFSEPGVRVPFVMISPWAKKHFVSHVVHEHTAITRFIETLFDLPALTARDANSDALLELFDWTGAAALMTPPTPPAVGKGGCVGVVLTSAKPNYAVGETIVLSYSNPSGASAKDYIAIFPYNDGKGGTTQPSPDSLAWNFIGGTQTPGAAPMAATVSFDHASVNKSTWPLPVGDYIAYYLINGSLDAAATLDINVK